MYKIDGNLGAEMIFNGPALFPEYLTDANLVFTTLSDEELPGGIADLPSVEEPPAETRARR